MSEQLEARLNKLEEWRKETDHLLFGNLQQAGVIPLLASLTETVRGPKGEGGIVKKTDQNSQDIRDAKVAARATVIVLSSLGGFIGSTIAILIAHYWK